MRKKIFVISSLIILAFCFWSSESFANEIAIKIQAVNPLGTETDTPVRAYLPKPAVPGDIINVNLQSETLENFETLFDEAKGQYYVEQKITLAPQEVKIFEVTVKDVWVIMPEKIERLRKTVSNLRGRIGLADELSKEILKNLDAMVKKQEQNIVALVGVKKHIEAYEENVEALGQVEADLKMLMNLLNIMNKH